jgi:3alpha(or 20beta)-hydroxysteroid dehydrogenase
MPRVKDKVAIVTGGSRGIGEAIVKLLVNEGARVVIADLLDEEGSKVASEYGANVTFMHLDVTNENEWQKLVSETQALYGPVSILVNNAGIAHICPLETYSEGEYRKVIDTNLMSVFFGMKSVLASMKSTGSGSIVNISSAAGLVGLAGASAYTASKFAVTGMTKSAALEFAPYHIRVNSVHPGFIETTITASLLSEDEAKAHQEETLALTPVGRSGTPQEIANVVLMLASDEASFCTGSEFVVDGGWTCQ